MQRKCVMKIGDNELFTKRSADMVTYGNKTVAQVLQNYDPASVPASTFGKKILACKNIDEFRNLLRVAKHCLYNESDDLKQLWTTGTPWLYTYNKPAFAKHSVACNADNRFNITLNLSNTFSVDFWLYSSTTPGSASTIYFQFYTNTSTNNWTIQSFYTGTGVWFTRNSDTSTYKDISGNCNSLRHYQFCSSGNKMYCFSDGVLRATFSVTVPAGKYAFKFSNGTANWFSEFRVLDGVCEHTAKFSVPTAPYDFTPQTAALLHFD